MLLKKNNLKVALDGPAGAGKSTVAREVSKRLGLCYLDTGAMYRALTLKIIRTGIPITDLVALERLLETTEISFGDEQEVRLDGEDVTAEIRSPAVNDLVSPVSAIPAVRRRLVALQQTLAASCPGIIMEGRDIGSKVMPDADFKFYLDATPLERARRRMKEQQGKGLVYSLEAVAAEIRKRDTIDSEREDSPLLVAPDAVVIDTTDLSFTAVVDKLTGQIKKGLTCKETG